MLGTILIILGAVLMVIGLIMLVGWVSGRNRLAQAILDRTGDSKTDRQFLGLYFIVLVLVPLLGGALLIAFGLRRLI